jgi:glycosyltransferase involved in cell wall biosynthesis
MHKVAVLVWAQFMRVIILSDTETMGGAAIATSRLASALTMEGVEVIRIVGSADGNEHPWTTIPIQMLSLEQMVLAVTARISQQVAANLKTLILSRRLNKLLGSIRPDIINVHNLHGADWGIGLIYACSRHAPVAWTLHDMWSFTGRCTYTSGCHQYMKGCNGSCPTSTEYPVLAPNLITKAWRQRRDLMSNLSNLVAVTPSGWLSREARTGFWAGHKVEVIPYGLPLDIYTPLSTHVAREALGIDSHGRVLMTAASNLSEERKGMSYLRKALQRLSYGPVTLLTLGKGTLNFEQQGVHLHQLGYIAHERTKVLAYSAADLFVHPALLDNLPNTVMEALACGTPVVGFPVGGVVEMVSPGSTGWLADGVSSQALAEILDKALNDSDRGLSLRESCRAKAEAEYDLSIQAKRYKELFLSLTR